LPPGVTSPVSQPQLGEDPGDMGLDSALADKQADGDLGVGQAADEQDQHLTLPFGEPAELRGGSAFAKLARAGIRISYYSSAAGFYIHGKVVEADYGTDHAKIFVGSENFSSTSLNQNRELGLIVSGHAVMSAIAGTFTTDFRNGRHWSSA